MNVIRSVKSKNEVNKPFHSHTDNFTAPICGMFLNSNKATFCVNLEDGLANYQYIK